MKKKWIFLIVGIVLIALISVTMLVMANVEKDTYVVDLRLEATSGYPAKLLQIRNQGINQETALLSIMPKFNFRGLSITESHTQMSGAIKIDCGQDYEETKNFNLATSNPGDQMRQEFLFKKIPPGSVCLIVAKNLECESEQLRCEKNTVSLTLRIPN